MWTEAFLSVQMLHFMVDHKLENVPVTTSDGRLVGLLLQKDVVAEMEKRNDAG